MVKESKELKERNEATSFIVNFADLGKREKGFTRTMIDEVLDLFAELPNAYHKVTVKPYIYRKIVEIDVEKLESDKKRLKELMEAKVQEAVLPFSVAFRKRLKARAIPEFHEFGDAIYDEPKPNVTKKLFELTGGTVEWELPNGEKVKATKKDWEAYRELLSLKSAVTEFERVTKSLGATNRLPVVRETMRYIKFEKGLATIDIGFYTGTYVSKLFTGRVLQQFVSTIYDEGWEIVEFAERGKLTQLNVLVENEKVDVVLAKLLEVYRSCQAELKGYDYSVHVQVTKDKGQETVKRMGTFILSGEHFDSVKKQLTLSEPEYFGLPSYK